MGKNLFEKIVSAHLLEGETQKGCEITIRADQTLTQDATGTLAYLELEKMGVSRVKTEKSVAYIDHNTLGCGFENADDHRFIRSAAAKFGVLYSPPGNGICHQVHLERFAAPGKTLIGSDSHTPTCGGMGTLAIGAGGLDVALAMGTGAYTLQMPGVIKVKAIGSLPPCVSAKDAALEILRRIGVKGGVGYVLEWAGEGVKSLSVPERATICNMGAETGATTSLFPSDENTRAFLRAQGREDDFLPLEADEDAVYDKVIALDLSSLEPLAACPHSPDNVFPVRELTGIKVDQVLIGSCTNSSLRDLLSAAAILKGGHAAPGVDLAVAPGSRQVLSMLSENGALCDLLSAGARLLECACGPCIGMGQSPCTKGVSLRTFNRNFEGRSGTADAQVYLVSPETAAASALTGVFTDPRSCGGAPDISLPETFAVDDSSILLPVSEKEAQNVGIVKGPNIASLPDFPPMPEAFEATAVLKVGDNITTDHIMPAGAAVLPYRSNIPKLSEFCFTRVDPDFPKNAQKAGACVIVGGENYGQGSSREHAALVPKYLGVKTVIAKSFARIHKANLINFGILPLTFEDPEDYSAIDRGDKLAFSGLFDLLKTGRTTVKDLTTGKAFTVCAALSDRQRKLLAAGGALNAVNDKEKSDD